MSTHWSMVREGDILALVLPEAGLSGSSPMVRVMSRSYRDGDPFEELTVQVIPDVQAGVPSKIAALSPLPAPPLVQRSDIGRAIVVQQRAIEEIKAER